MLQALLRWAETAPPDQADSVQELLHQCLGLGSSSSREFRVTFAHETSALAQPLLLKAMYGHTASGSSQQPDLAVYEAKLLQVGLVLIDCVSGMAHGAKTQRSSSSGCHCSAKVG